MNSLTQNIVQAVSAPGQRWTVVRNPDGFLSRPDTQLAVRQQAGLLLLAVSNSLELRVRLELYDRQSPEKVCYVIDSQLTVAPDLMLQLADRGTFALSDCLPTLDAKTLLACALSFDEAAYLHSRRYAYNLTPTQTLNEVRDSRKGLAIEPAKLCKDLLDIPLQWDKVETIDALSAVLLKAIRHDAYNEVETALDSINRNFQDYLNKYYFTLHSSSANTRPKLVNRVLPFIAQNHSRQERVALIVVDGMTYWQYLILHDRLSMLGLQPQKDMTMAWLPTITQRSRQALYRGQPPKADYHQSPQNEAKLWTAFWTSNQPGTGKRMRNDELEYEHGTMLADSSGRPRLARVDVELDKKMHASSNNKDLYDLTANWAVQTAPTIKSIFERKHSPKYTL